LLQKIEGVKKASYKNLIVTTVLFAVTSLFICWIWLTYNPQFITTKLGIVLIILAMAIYGYSLNQQYPLLKNMDSASSNTEHLTNLLALKKKQQFLQTTMMNLYFILLSSGLGLYLIEYAQMMPTFWAIFAYAITGLWMLFNWFYIRPKTIKKQQAKLNDIIGKFENIQTQLKE
jgi:hypothetical protein